MQESKVNDSLKDPLKIQWIHRYGLFLFDFDGLLVNTEELHYLAYKKMCADRGFSFDWDFNRYCQVAHYQAAGLKEHLYQLFPPLEQIEPNWDVLYSEKKQALIDLLNKGSVHLMPGVERLLRSLHTAGISSCVVTHSPNDLVDTVRRQNPILDTIPFWITREHYGKPKPDPECYLTAMSKYSRPGKKVIGFEDTPRGLTALFGTPATRVLICEAAYPEVPAFVKQGAFHFSSFAAIPDDWEE